ncbi:aminoglycoside phosphotransferase family protein [Flindersiella endophytica]
MRGTHAIEHVDGVVVKRFRSWDRGEPRREWEALTLLARYAPGLAPEPVRAELAGDPPTIVMSRVPGEPLGERPIGSAQLDALADAIHRLHRAVPSDALRNLPRAFSPSVLADKAERLHGRHPPSADSLVRKAFSVGGAWLHGDDVPRLLAAEAELVFGQGDGNLANCLWDGRRIRLVDFEDSGSGDRAFELAELVEHLSAIDAGLEVAALLGRFDLTRAESDRLFGFRRLEALTWFLMLLPGGAAHVRNPPEALPRQAIRLLTLLESPG